LAAAAAQLDVAEQQVLTARAEIGAFQRTTLDSSRAVLDTQIEEFAAAYSDIVDVDLASETSQFIRTQILSHASFWGLWLFSRPQPMGPSLSDAISPSQWTQR